MDLEFGFAISDFPGYFYNIEDKKVYSSRSKKYLSSRFSGRRIKFDLFKKNKCYVFYDDQLEYLVTGKQKEIPPGKKISNFPNYTITQNGEVYNLTTRKKLKESTNCEYISLCLYKHGNRQDLYIHRLVAKTYIPNPDNFPEVNHINGVKTDNRVENLEWCTRNHNIIHAHKTGLNKGSKRSVLQIEIIDKEDEVSIFKSIAEASRSTGVSSGAICTACKKEKKCRGYRWKYSNPNPRPGIAQEIKAIKIIEEDRLVRDFESAEDAGRAMAIHPSNIINACRGRHKLAKGYKWEYADISKDKKVDDEEWKSITGFSKYKISTNGEIYSTIYNRKLCTQHYAGYEMVRLVGDDGNRKTMKVHRLVCLTYELNPQNKRVVNHKNGVKSDNSRENLEWNTDSENVLHAINNGLCNVRKPVIQHTLDGEEVARYPSAWDASKKMEIVHSAICNACRGYSKTCKGYKWKYDSKIEK